MRCVLAYGHDVDPLSAQPGVPGGRGSFLVDVHSQQAALCDTTPPLPGGGHSLLCLVLLGLPAGRSGSRAVTWSVAGPFPGCSDQAGRPDLQQGRGSPSCRVWPRLRWWALCPGGAWVVVGSGGVPDVASHPFSWATLTGGGIVVVSAPLPRQGLAPSLASLGREPDEGPRLPSGKRGRSQAAGPTELVLLPSGLTVPPSPQQPLQEGSCAWGRETAGRLEPRPPGHPAPRVWSHS